ncbi:hypothetical protein [Floridanema aerugineum]|uniref:PLD phosphodiesterase domain-containing protein n=1 Tax=Floridaenema aerugineum BLCC-F46 TaxID=3153654 RepID=A0ABV4XF96_9CYAN
MFLASSPKPIDANLKETADKIEQQSPGLSVLAARQFRYGVSQVSLEVTISEPRKFNVLEEFILRAGIELEPPPKVDELATVLGLDRVFVENTTRTLRSLQTLAWTTDGSIALTPQGRQFYAQGSVPQPPQTKQIYAITDPLNCNLFFLASALEETKIDLPELEDFMAIENRSPDIYSLSLAEFQQLIEASSLGLHAPKEGKIITEASIIDEPINIWQSISIFVIFDLLEDKINLQVRRGKQVLEYPSTWLNVIQQAGMISLQDLFSLSEETIASERNLLMEAKNAEVEARIEKINHIAIENVLENRTNPQANKTALIADKGSVILLRDSQIRTAFLDTLKSARQEILIFSPWVSEEVIDDEFIKLLENLAKQGVSVLIGYGIARKQEEEERQITPTLQEKLTGIKTPDNLPAVQIFWLGNSHAKEVVVDRKIHLCGSHNFLSYRGDRLPRGETVYKVTIPEQVQEAYQFLASRFNKQAQKLWKNALKMGNEQSAEAAICVWFTLSMEEEALKQLQQNNWLKLLPIWLKLGFQGLKSKKISSDSEYFPTALSLLTQFSGEDANIELLREGWRKVIGAIATQNPDQAVKLLTDEIWTEFTRLGIAESPIDSPQKFIAKYVLEQQEAKKPTKNKSQTVSQKKGRKKN